MTGDSLVVNSISSKLGLKLDFAKQLTIHEEENSTVHAGPSTSAEHEDILCPGTPDEQNCGSPLGCLDSIVDNFQDGSLFNTDTDSSSGAEEMDMFRGKRARKTFQVNFGCFS